LTSATLLTSSFGRDMLTSTCAEHDVALLVVTHSPEVAARFPKRLRLEDFNRAAVHHG
jgi:predicted ABC-type transport system involved in lysophospholipase L1 biosynthesis ATPase subunit